MNDFINDTGAPKPDWRSVFHTGDELPDGDLVWIVEQILPEGIGFIGAHSGAGKTWLALSFARAISTGTPFLGIYKVPVAIPVLYLCPEMSARGLKRRMKLFHIPMNSDAFRCQTISDGVPLPLDAPALITAIKELKPIVFLDTAMRFSHAEDENDAAQNARGIANAIFSLIHLGARSVVCLHHRAKAAKEAVEMTLENTLRGTGDIGAICDVVIGIRTDRGSSPDYAKESKKLIRLEFKCVKLRDAIEPDEFRIQGFPSIENTGDFEVLTAAPDAIAHDDRQSEVTKMRNAIEVNRKATFRQLQDSTDIGLKRIKQVAAAAGYTQKDGVWQSTQQPTLEERITSGEPI
jgi:hypothetical protein